MRRFLIAFAVASLSLAVGCANKSDSSMSENRSSTMAGADQCAHCAGVQHANAEGKCPGCGAAIMKSNAK